MALKEADRHHLKVTKELAHIFMDNIVDRFGSPVDTQIPREEARAFWEYDRTITVTSKLLAQSDTQPKQTT